MLHLWNMQGRCLRFGLMYHVAAFQVQRRQVVMRYSFGFLCLSALGLVWLVGCADAGDTIGQVFPCTEQGIRNAIAEGGGPHTFDCAGPTTVMTESEIVIGKSVTIDGEALLTVDGTGGASRVFSVEAGTRARLLRLTITGGGGGGVDGGGIKNEGTLAVERSRVVGNYGDLDGGGIDNRGVLVLTSSSVSANTVGYPSGGGRGAGIYNGPAATLTLDASTVSGNLTYDPPDPPEELAAPKSHPPSFGGGVYNEGTMMLINSTVSGNEGGGVYNLYEATATLSHCTVDGIWAAGTLTVTSSLISIGCSGTVTNSSYSIESPGDTCGFDESSDQVNVADLKLGPLRDNGGPTETHALLPGSVAIDVIPVEACEVIEDQRGEPRPETGGTLCDVGAFELTQGNQ